MLKLLLLLTAALCPAEAQPSLADLGRAKARKPRAEFQGHGTLASANARLNGHLLRRPNLRTVACEALSTADLRATLRGLFALRSEGLVAVYPKGDGRHSTYSSVEEMEQHWTGLPDDEGSRQRDGHCHEAVMWFVHHLTAAAQEEFAKVRTLPLLPEQEHATAAGDVSTQLYASKVTCQRCHVGGLDNLGKPEVKPETPQALARRCYTNYKDLFNLTCGPCDGISGIYTGDDDAYFKAPPCKVVAQPHDVPEAERVRPKLPHQFTVDVMGSDRFGRNTNPEGGSIIERLYGQIAGKWFMDVRPGAEQWYLRHDTTYNSLSLDGHALPLIKHASVTEIHVQSTAQKKANVTGPMVSLIEGVPDWIPGGCTCIPDPVGVPDITATEATGLDHMEYLGRIKLDPIEYQNETVELDHWADWFFHIFMETDKSAPAYGKAPRRLGSAYAGMAVYSNWVMEDPALKDPDVWRRGIPTSPEIVGPDHGKFCLNPKKVEACNNISQSTFPPPEGAHKVVPGPRPAKSLLAPTFFPLGGRLASQLAASAERLQSFAGSMPKLYI